MRSISKKHLEAGGGLICKLKVDGLLIQSLQGTDILTYALETCKFLYHSRASILTHKASQSLWIQPKAELCV